MCRNGWKAVSPRRLLFLLLILLSHDPPGVLASDATSISPRQAWMWLPELRKRLLPQREGACLLRNMQRGRDYHGAGVVLGPLEEAPDDVLVSRTSVLFTPWLTPSPDVSFLTTRPPDSNLGKGGCSRRCAWVARWRECSSGQ